MKSFRALCMKELQCFFLSPTAYVTIVFFLLLMGFSMWYMMDMLSSGAVTGSLMRVLFGESIFFWVAMLISVPVITMRLLAEEKKMGTIEGLLTAPVPDSVIVLAKYTAALVFFVAMWLPTVTYAYILRYFDSGAVVDFRPMASAYLGTLLIGAFFLAIGLLASALTRNQVVAAIISFTLISLAFFGGFIPYVTTNPSVRHVATYFSPVLHMMDFSRGVIDTRPLVLYGTGILLALFATVRVVESGKWK